MQTNFQLMRKLLMVSLGMFAFGYMLVPIYEAFCEWTGSNAVSYTHLTLPTICSV